MIDYKIYDEAMNNTIIADGFFENWAIYPDKNKHRQILLRSYRAIVAIDDNKIIGFINIISDGVLSAYIPLLEVIPEYRNRGIGIKLVELAIEEMKEIYMLDLSCDDNLLAFYKKFGMHESNAMIIRNYNTQNAKGED